MREIPGMVKITVRVSRGTFNELERARTELGITRTLMGNICILLGMKALLRSLAPERTLDDETIARLARIVKEDTKLGG